MRSPSPRAALLTVAFLLGAPRPAAAAPGGGGIAAAGARSRGAADQAGQVHLPVTTFQLKNGLTVLVHEDHAAPVVAVDVWFHVGSKDERPGRTGFAHLFEHLMFQGSAHVGDDEHLRLVAEAGGSANATTSEDRTNFFETVPSNFLDRALFLESDRMGWFVEALDQKKLDTQRDVVLNERRQSYENRPYGMAPFAIHAAIYPADHPYHSLTIGSPDDLLAANLDDVKAFFQTWYTPANATLAITGDVKPAQVRRLAERYFGDIPSQPAPAHAAAPAPVRLARDKRDRIEDRVSLERLYVTWPSPAWFAPGDAELDLLGSMLAGKSGRLYRRLVYDLKVAQSVMVGQQSAKLGSLFQIVVTARPGHTAAEMEKIVDEELAKLLGPQPITKEELSRAQNRWDATFVYGLQSVETRADLLSQYQDALGRADGLDRDRRRYLDATVGDVQKTAADVLRGHRHVLSIVPFSGRAAGPAAPAKPTAAAAAKNPVKPVNKPVNTEVH